MYQPLTNYFITIISRYHNLNEALNFFGKSKLLILSGFLLNFFFFNVYLVLMIFSVITFRCFWLI